MKKRSYAYKRHYQPHTSAGSKKLKWFLAIPRAIRMIKNEVASVEQQNAVSFVDSSFSATSSESLATAMTSLDQNNDYESYQPNSSKSSQTNEFKGVRHICQCEHHLTFVSPDDAKKLCRSFPPRFLRDSWGQLCLNRYNEIELLPLTNHDDICVKKHAVSTIRSVGSTADDEDGDDSMNVPVKGIYYKKIVSPGVICSSDFDKAAGTRCDMDRPGVNAILVAGQQMISDSSSGRAVVPSGNWTMKARKSWLETNELEMEESLFAYPCEQVPLLGSNLARAKCFNSRRVSYRRRLTVSQFEYTAEEDVNTRVPRKSTTFQESFQQREGYKFELSFTGQTKLRSISVPCMPTPQATCLSDVVGGKFSEKERCDEVENQVKEMHVGDDDEVFHGEDNILAGAHENDYDDDDDDDKKLTEICLSHDSQRSDKVRDNMKNDSGDKAVSTSKMNDQSEDEIISVNDRCSSNFNDGVSLNQPDCKQDSFISKSFKRQSGKIIVELEGEGYRDVSLSLRIGQSSVPEAPWTCNGQKPKNKDELRQTNENKGFELTVNNQSNSSVLNLVEIKISLLDKINEDQTYLNESDEFDREDLPEFCDQTGAVVEIRVEVGEHHEDLSCLQNLRSSPGMQGGNAKNSVQKRSCFQNNCAALDKLKESTNFNLNPSPAVDRKIELGVDKNGGENEILVTKNREKEVIESAQQDHKNNVDVCVSNINNLVHSFANAAKKSHNNVRLSNRGIEKIVETVACEKNIVEYFDLPGEIQPAKIRISLDAEDDHEMSYDSNRCPCNTLISSDTDVSFDWENVASINEKVIDSTCLPCVAAKLISFKNRHSSCHNSNSNSSLNSTLTIVATTTTTVSASKNDTFDTSRSFLNDIKALGSAKSYFQNRKNRRENSQMCSNERDNQEQHNDWEHQRHKFCTCNQIANPRHSPTSSRKENTVVETCSSIEIGNIVLARTGNKQNIPEVPTLKEMIINTSCQSALRKASTENVKLLAESMKATEEEITDNYLSLENRSADSIVTSTPVNRTREREQHVDDIQNISPLIRSESKGDSYFKSDVTCITDEDSLEHPFGSRVTEPVYQGNNSFGQTAYKNRQDVSDKATQSNEIAAVCDQSPYFLKKVYLFEKDRERISQIFDLDVHEKILGTKKPNSRKTKTMDVKPQKVASQENCVDSTNESSSSLILNDKKSKQEQSGWNLVRIAVAKLSKAKQTENSVNSSQPFIESKLYKINDLVSGIVTRRVPYSHQPALQEENLTTKEMLTWDGAIKSSEFKLPRPVIVAAANVNDDDEGAVLSSGTALPRATLPGKASRRKGKFSRKMMQVVQKLKYKWYTQKRLDEDNSRVRCKSLRYMLV